MAKTKDDGMYYIPKKYRYLLDKFSIDEIFILIAKGPGYIEQLIETDESKLYLTFNPDFAEVHEKW